MSSEQKIDVFGFVYLKFPYGANVEFELGRIETRSKGTNYGRIVFFSFF